MPAGIRIDEFASGCGLTAGAGAARTEAHHEKLNSTKDRNGLAQRMLVSLSILAVP
jgi:hypothetical protein